MPGQTAPEEMSIRPEFNHSRHRGVARELCLAAAGGRGYPRGEPTITLRPR